MKKRLLVTGSTRGIGLGIARSVLESPEYELVLHGRAPSTETAELERLHPDRVSFLGFDIRDRDGARELLAAETETRGPFWGIVCSAGVSGEGTFAGIPGAEWDSIVRTNLDAFYNVVQPLVLPMVRLRAGGRIIVVSSLAGVHGNRGQVHYSAAKAGLIGAVKALAQELATRSIAVNAVAPGFIETDMLAKYPSDELVKRVPMGRLGTAAEVGALVRYLLSDPAGYMTGQTLTLAGGL